MAFQVFIALLFLTAAFGLYFAPRNRHVGLRTKHTYANDRIWTKTNRFAAVLFAVAGAGLLYFSNKGYSNDDFYFFVTIGIVAIAFLSLRYALSLARNLPTEGEKPMEPKRTGKRKTKKKELVFSETRKMSVFFSLLCIFFTAVAYVWIFECLSFMPEDLGMYDHEGGQIALGFGLRTYSLAVNAVFFGGITACATAFIVAANYYRLRLPARFEYSLKLSLSDMFFAYMASISLLTACANYAFYRSTASSRVGADEMLTMMMPLAGIALVWFSVFKINARLSKNTR